MPVREAQMARRRTAVAMPLPRSAAPPSRTAGHAEARPKQQRSASIPFHMYFLLVLIAFLGLPWVFHIGPMRMSSYRIVLCLAVLPSLIYWVRGKAGGIKVADLCVIAFSGWIALSMIMLNGSVGVQSAGITVLETIAPYFLARCCIRSADDFRLFGKALFLLIAMLLPLVAIEAVTGVNVIFRVLGFVFPTYDMVGMTRSGLFRAQGPFAHPILLGLVCSTSFSIAYLVLGYGASMMGRCVLAGTVALATMCAISSGPLLGVALQCMLIAWKRLADRIGLQVVWSTTLLLYAAAQIICWVTGRSLLTVTISRLTFDPMSYWFRNLIWEYGWSSVLTNPWLGTGLNEWARPSWMPSSIDNIWLYFAVKHGLPASFLLALSVICCLLLVGLKRGLDCKHKDYRCAYLVTVISCCLVGLTVHFWDGAYVLMFCILGSGIWIADVKTVAAKPQRLQRRVESSRTGKPEVRPEDHRRPQLD
ncbi:O-antigen ligase family protein [Rhizobium sp. Rhizsp42]|uniref:O-antigen ligase family protein n=1 Tax=Rhizobium sp. Rhizsp42 TaxID=3243034 RepID=UPI0039B0966B